MQNPSKKPIVLVILDGFGYRKDQKYNAISKAATPFLDHYQPVYLNASGTAVGLPKGFTGNSEVGHNTIGAGRIIKQPLVMINEMIENNTFCDQPLLARRLLQLKQSGGTLHIIGLLSDAGVHSYAPHLYALIKCAADIGLKNIIVHPILDGRDTSPYSAEDFLRPLDLHLQKIPGAKIGSIHGRFYAMDRDRNWERTHKSFSVLTSPHPKTISWKNILDKSYAIEVSDEYIVPTPVTKESHIKTGDGVIIFNFREDRMRQLTSLLASLPLEWLIAFVDYDPLVKIDVLIDKTPVSNTLLDELEAHNKTIFTIAETEKYAHVTYFFSGGREIKRAKEERVLIPSHKDTNYKNNPEMAASEITAAVCNSLKTPKDFYLVNYANADMVGHTGDESATIKAVECLDKQLKKLYDAVVEKQNGILIVTADHGNAEQMWDNKSKQSHTQHTTNKVPFYIISQDTSIQATITELSHIAPYILSLMNLPIPKAMR